MDHTPADTRAKIAELKRELAFRDAVYRKWIKSGRLSPDRANRQVFVLKCILQDYTGDHPTKLPVLGWDCPVCGSRNHARAGDQVVYCLKDEPHPDRCGGGPFLLLPVKTNRAMDPNIRYTVHRVEGVEYPVVQSSLDL